MAENHVLISRRIRAHYGAAQALFDVSFELAEREKLAILGINGMGKSTLASVLAGLMPSTGGHLTFCGDDVTGRPAHALAQLGIALVPQGRRVFGSLTVEENLRVAARGRGSAGGVGSAYELFPSLIPLRGRQANALSGGEQQMLAIGRALARGPKLLILDEPTEGLAPIVIDRLAQALHQMAPSMSMILLEQRRRFAEDLCDRVLEMRQRGVLDPPVD
jgi:branched-chain amino acid transport system ATP-binding protein